MLCDATGRDWYVLFAVAVLGWLGPEGVSAGEPSPERPITIGLGDLPNRNWSDNTGLYQAQGTLVGLGPRHIRILKVNGRNSTVPLRRLSQRDLHYVEQFRVGHFPANSLLAQRPARQEPVQRQPAQRELAQLKPAQLKPAQHARVHRATALQPPAQQAIAPRTEVQRATARQEPAPPEPAKNATPLPQPSQPVSLVHAQPEIPFNTDWWLDESDAGASAQPVIYVRVSHQLIGLLASRTYQRSNPVSDSVLGRCVYGTAHTSASTEARLVDNSSNAVVDYVIRGTTFSSTSTDAGIVQVHGSANTHFEKRIRVRIDERGIGIEPAPLQSSTHSTINCISTRARLFRRLIGRIATRQAYQQKPQFDFVASQRAHARIESAIDADWREAVDVADRFLASTSESLLDAPEPIRLRPRFQTSTEGLQVVLTGRVPADLPTIGSPPPVSGGPLLVVQVHASFVTAVLRDQEVGEFLAPLLDKLRVEPAEDEVLADVLRRLQASPPVLSGFPEDADAEWATIVWNPQVSSEQFVKVEGQERKAES